METLGRCKGKYKAYRRERHNAPIMENQPENKMEHETETGALKGLHIGHEGYYPNNGEANGT